MTTSIARVHRVVDVAEQHATNARSCIDGMPDAEDLSECMSWLVELEQSTEAAIGDLRRLLEEIAKKEEKE